MHHKLLRQRLPAVRGSAVRDYFRVVSRSSSVDTTESQMTNVALDDYIVVHARSGERLRQPDSPLGRDEDDAEKKGIRHLQKAAAGIGAGEPGHGVGVDSKPAAKAAPSGKSSSKSGNKSGSTAKGKQQNTSPSTSAPTAASTSASRPKKTSARKGELKKTKSNKPTPKKKRQQHLLKKRAASEAIRSTAGATQDDENTATNESEKGSVTSQSVAAQHQEVATAGSSAASESISSELAAVNAGLSNPLTAHAHNAAFAAAPGDSRLAGLQMLAGLGQTDHALAEAMILRRALLAQQLAHPATPSAAVAAYGLTGGAAAAAAARETVALEQYHAAIAAAASPHASLAFGGAAGSHGASHLAALATGGPMSATTEQLLQLHKRRLMEEYMAEMTLRQELQQQQHHQALLEHRLGALGAASFSGGSPLVAGLAASQQRENPSAASSPSLVPSSHALGGLASSDRSVGGTSVSDSMLAAALQQRMGTHRRLSTVQDAAAANERIVAAATAAAAAAVPSSAKRKSPTSTADMAKRMRTTVKVEQRVAPSPPNASVRRNSAQGQTSLAGQRNSSPSSEDDAADDSARSKRFRPYQSEQWTEKFAELMEFNKEHGHCQVPHSYKKNPPLARWVKRQRYQYRLKREGRLSTMTDERVKMLENLGFIWDSHAAAWAEKLNELKEYMERYGHCNVPVGCSENPQLATWVKCQRRQYKLFWDGKTSNMTPHRIEQLNAIGFCWSVRNVSSSGSRKSSIS